MADSMPSPTPALSGSGKALRSIALFEGLKGLAAFAIGIGLINLLHHDLKRLVLELMGQFGLDSAQPFRVLMLHYADVLNDTPLDTLEMLVGAYLFTHLVEAYGLWPVAPKSLGGMARRLVRRPLHPF